MAFATKYRIKTVSNVYGGVQCDIQKDGYAGSVIELEGQAPDPIELKIGRNVQDIADPILAGEVNLSFYVTGNQDTLELSSDLPFTWKVVITQQVSNNPIWQGWIQPESYQEAYHSTPYSVGVRATDGLDDLKAIPFVAGATDETLWDYLLTALASTGVSLPFKESINIYDTVMNSTAADSPLLQAEALASSFLVISDEPSCYQVIDAILRPLFSRIFQCEGYWRVENIQGKRSSYVERTYTSAGVYGSQATVNPLKILSNATPDFRQFISKSGQLQTIPAVNNARVFFETTSGEPSDAIPGFSTDADWTDASTLADWTQTSGFTITKQAVNYKGNNFGVKINGRQTTLSNRYIESPAFSVAAATFGSLNLSFSYLMDWPSLVVFGSKPVFYVEIILEAAVNTYYWKNEWVQAIQRNPLQTANRNVWEDWSTAIASVPEDGNIKIRLYQSVKNGSEGSTQVTVTNWKFEAEQDVEISAKYRMESGVLNFLAGLNPVDREVYFSDGDTVTRPGVLSVGSTLTTSWSRRGATDNIPLLRLFLLQFLSLHQRPAIKLQGQLHQRGEQIMPYHTVQDNASVSTRKYVMVSYVMGLTTGVGRVSYRELLETDASPTYLSELFSQLPFDFNFTSPSQQPFGPAIPSLPDFNFNLNGDVFGQPGTTTLSKSAIVDKPALDLTAAPESSTILLNAVSNVVDSTPMTNITALSLITEWPDKATPIEEDKIPILDSVTGEIRMAGFFVESDIENIGVDGVDVYAGDNVDGDRELRKVFGTRGVESLINTNDEVEIAKKYTAIYLDHAASHDLAIVPGSIFFIKVAGNTTIANPSEFPHCHFQIILENVDGGTYTVDWGTKWIFEEDTPPAFPASEGFCLVLDNVAKENEYIWPDVSGPFDSPGATDPPSPPVPDPEINTFGSLGSASSKYIGTTLAANGKIYCIPYNSSSVLVIDPSTNTTSSFGSFGSGGSLWFSASRAANGKIYCSPYNSPNILVIDPATDTTSTLGSFGAGGAKYTSNLLASDGNIYIFPFFSTSIIKVDPVANTTSTFGSLSAGANYEGGVLGENAKIYLIPRAATSVYEYDPISNTSATFGSLGAGDKWSGGVLAYNSKIFGIPRNSLGILVIDTATNTTSTFGSFTGNVKWFGGSLAPNERIYAIPRDFIGTLEIDTDANTTATYGNLTSSAKFGGGTLAANSKIYGAPLNFTGVLEISNIGTATSAMVTMPASLADLPTSVYNRHQNKL